MPLPQEYNNQKSEIASYDYTDIAAATGMVNFYLYAYKDSTSERHGLTQTAVYPSSTTITGSISGTDGEYHKDMYRRLKALTKRFIKLGAEYENDAWVKSKYVKALMPFESFDLKTLKNKHNYHEMTSNEVMQEVEASKVENA